VISFYDLDFKLLKNTGINKYYESFMDIGRSLGTRLRNGKLEIICTSLKGFASYTDLYCTADVTTMTVEKTMVIDREPLGSTISTEPNCTVWLKDGFILNYIFRKGTVFAKAKYFTTVLQPFTYL
jgi:hypothetical protein